MEPQETAEWVPHKGRGGNAKLRGWKGTEMGKWGKWKGNSGLGDEIMEEGKRCKMATGRRNLSAPLCKMR